MITDAEDFFTKGCGRCARFATPDCSARLWHQGLHDLRRIANDAGLQETVKWGHPCYMHADRNIVMIGAFRGDFRLTFFNAAPLADPDGLLEKPGPNTQTASMIRFTDNALVLAKEPAIRAYIAEAMLYAQAGLLPPKVQADFTLPDELVQALDADPALAEAFHALTPGRQKSYVINLNGTASPATRRARIAKFRGKILAGKGALDR
jgi:uncharacterized protein YdeI (YjbR/CyaY-like superfamily)